MLFAAWLVSICAWFTLPTAARSPKDSWVRLRTPNFVLVGNADPKKMQSIALRLEQFRAAFSRVLPSMQYTAPVPVNVLVFGSMKDYAPFRPGNAAGHFMPGREVDYIALTTDLNQQQHPESVIFHEYTHLLLKNSSLREVPLWFNEGLSEYYSTFRLQDDRRVTLGEKVPAHLYTLRQEPLLPLATLFAADISSPYYNEDQKQNIFYAQSWLLVHYLIQGNNGARQAQLGQFIDLLLAKTPVEDAFKRAFKTTYGELENELKIYARQDHFPATTITLDRKVETDRTATSEPLPESSVQAYEGDLLFHMHAPAAETYLRRALELDPNQPLALASLGLLESERGAYAAARPLLERAVSFDGSNYYLQFRYAEALLKENENQFGVVDGMAADQFVKIRNALKAAIQLKPEFADPYRLLAYLSLLDNREVDESTVLVERALAAAPGRYDLMFMLGQLYFNRHDLPLARAVLERVAKDGGTDELRQNATRILRNLSDLEASDRQAKNEDEGKAIVRGPAGDAAPGQAAPVEGYLALRPVLAGETRIRGELVRIDCTGGRGVVLLVRSDGRELRFRGADLGTIRFNSFTEEVTDGIQIGCGALPKPQLVLATYRPFTGTVGKFDGEAVSIEFIPLQTQLP
jgi:hypothetical protein